MPDYKVGQVVKVNPDNDNENYFSFRDVPLKIIHVATGVNQHPGYDDTMKGQGLYNFINAINGVEIGCSLYDYELVPYEKD